MNRFEYLWKAQELQDKMINTAIEGWFKNEFLTFHWWLLVIFLLVPWIIWFKVADRKRMMEMGLFGTLIIISTTSLDAIGSDLNFWAYPTKLMPITPRAIPFDMSLIPIAFMLLYQYFRKWKSFMIALICMAAFYAFVGEPLSHLFQLVLYIKWKYIYSFLYYILIGIVVKVIIEQLKGSKDSIKI